MLNKKKSINEIAREMRRSLGLNQQELAEFAGVSKDEVDSFEYSIPVPLENKQKILKILCDNLKQQIMSEKRIDTHNMCP